MQIRQCTAFRLASGDVIGAQVVEREPLSIFFSTSALLITVDHSVLKTAGLWWVAYRVENISGTHPCGRRAGARERIDLDRVRTRRGGRRLDGRRWHEQQHAGQRPDCARQPQRCIDRTRSDRLRELIRPAYAGRDTPAPLRRWISKDGGGSACGGRAFSSIRRCSGRRGRLKCRCRPCVESPPERDLDYLVHSIREGERGHQEQCSFDKVCGWASQDVGRCA